MVQDEKQTELCLRILQTCRAELCDLFPESEYGPVLHM